MPRVVWVTNRATITAGGTTQVEIAVPNGQWVVERASVFCNGTAGGYASILHARAGSFVSLISRIPLFPAKPGVWIEPFTTVEGGDIIRGDLTFGVTGGTWLGLTVWLREVS